MKVGIRKPSISKSFSARTTGRINRSIKKATIPLYGKSGTGIIKNPKKAIYNKVYNKTTVKLFPSVLGIFGKKGTVAHKSLDANALASEQYEDNDTITINERTTLEKVCKYCDTANDLDAKKCSGCGAHEFLYKCKKCGNTFDTGNFCPVCVNNLNYDEQPSLIKERWIATGKLFLWMLGWIFMFPLPLTILFVRHKTKYKIVKALKIVVLVFAWATYILFSYGFIEVMKEQANPTVTENTGVVTDK